MLLTPITEGLLLQTLLSQTRQALLHSQSPELRTSPHMPVPRLLSYRYSCPSECLSFLATLKSQSACRAH